MVIQNSLKLLSELSELETKISKIESKLQSENLNYDEESLVLLVKEKLCELNH